MFKTRFQVMNENIILLYKKKKEERESIFCREQGQLTQVQHFGQQE